MNYDELHNRFLMLLEYDLEYCIPLDRKFLFDQTEVTIGYIKGNKQFFVSSEPPYYSDMDEEIKFYHFQDLATALESYNSIRDYH